MRFDSSVPGGIAGNVCVERFAQAQAQQRTEAGAERNRDDRFQNHTRTPATNRVSPSSPARSAVSPKRRIQSTPCKARSPGALVAQSQACFDIG